jgi:hypothetical protein
VLAHRLRRPWLALRSGLGRPQRSRARALESSYTSVLQPGSPQCSGWHPWRNHRCWNRAVIVSVKIHGFQVNQSRDSQRMPRPNGTQLLARDGVPCKYRLVEFELIQHREHVIAESVSRVVRCRRGSHAGCPVSPAREGPCGEPFGLPFFAYGAPKSFPSKSPVLVKSATGALGLKDTGTSINVAVNVRVPEVVS